MTEDGLVYPAPSVVIGLGRFGLAVLERLGEDWQQLRLSGADLSLRNLRLFWIRSPDEAEGRWRQIEVDQLRVARYVGGDDMPSIALDFVLLRTLGLVRYRHGTYQVALPQDRGAVRASDLRLRSERRQHRDDERLVRRRYFEWLDLDPDPLLAAEQLRRKAERQGTLHLFIAPLVSRIRQGHSPWVLLAAILRCRALAAGRDPSPWRWVQQEVAHEQTGGRIGETSDPPQGVEIRKEVIQRILDDPDNGYAIHDPLLDDIAPPPLQQAESAVGWPYREEAISLPPAFVPHPDDPEAPVDTFQLLGEDWQTTGWATDLNDRGETPFRPLGVSRFRLGLFDHATNHREGANEFTDSLDRRLRCLADYLYRGLVRLWVDLNREQVEERSPLPVRRSPASLDETLQQSLTMLHELVVRPLEEDQEGPREAADPAGPLGFPHELADEPTQFLRSLVMDPDPRWWEESALERRLSALGLFDLVVQPARQLLMREVVFDVDDSNSDGTRDTIGSQDLRKALNHEVRDLLDFSYLAAYRKRPTRTPPRLTVFVVGDMSEPFTRVKMTAVLRDVHSELLRSFSSMFELHREGFDRALSVVPILWMPHPADPFSGELREKARLGEEAVIIDAVHTVRRWVEAVLPSARRRISQIFINGRVTDTSVLTLHDSISQTRDFLAFQIRNDLSHDDWLRRTAVGPGGDDFFASFACCEIEFPAERAREYLANRMARDCLHRLRNDTQKNGREGLQLPVPRSALELMRDAHSKLRQLTLEEAEGLKQKIWNALGEGHGPSRCIPQIEVLRRFSDRFEESLWQSITELWQKLTHRRGRMDELVDNLRCQTSQELRAALPLIRHHADDDIEQTSAQGLPAVLDRLEKRRRGAFAMLKDTEEERREGEKACQKHNIPSRGELSRARREVVEAAERKPDCVPQRLGLLAWLLLTPATGIPLSQFLHPAIGAIAPIVAGALLLIATGAILWFHTRRRHRKLLQAIEALAGAVHRLVAGGGEEDVESQSPSLRSFFDMRLRFTTALARRGYALHVYEQAAIDERLGQRLRESIDIQEHRMVRRAEALGVRPGPPGVDEKDDLRSLFVRRAGGRIERLIDPEHLMEFYHSRVRPGEEPLSEFLRAVGGVREWRKTACLSDSHAVMGFGRGFFASVAAKPITELDYFAEGVGEHLREFAGRHYANLGFGAKFLGYEGLDPDGVRLIADATLVADRPLLNAYERAEERAEEEARAHDRLQRRPRTLERLAYPVRPNAAYMLSLVQGVRAHSVHNLKRFESFHDRPDVHSNHPPPVHYLTGYQTWARDLYRQVRRAVQNSVEAADGGERLAEKAPQGAVD